MSKNEQKIYSSIYKNYDTINTILSFGTMRLWRKVAANEAVKGNAHQRILDIASGTGELSFEMKRIADSRGKTVDIIGMDLNQKMLQVAKRKAGQRDAQIKFELGDAMRMKYADSSFDIATSGFGLKGLDNPKQFSAEVHRVLKNGGEFVFLDIARSDSSAGRLFIGAYWTIIGWLCRIIGKGSYISIINSITDFDKAKFAKILKDAGFKDVKIRKPLFGPAFLMTGRK